jgi:TPR repeat protein
MVGEPKMRIHTFIKRILPLVACLLIATGCDDAFIGLQETKAQTSTSLIKAAELGDAVAQFNLGLRYYNGQGVLQDYKEAVKWWSKAAEQGHASAQFNLGLRYALGEGVAQDYKEAVKWWRKAAEQGAAHAQYNLGASYANGQGVPKDDKEAVKWYRKAAEQGYASAQYNLGVRYANGQGVTLMAEDHDVNAYAWYNVSSANGAKNGSNSREMVAKEMTPEQIAKAQELSKVWFEKFQPKE